MKLLLNFYLALGLLIGFPSFSQAQELPLLLSASWCPVCIIAREFLEKQGETFQELDIDTSPEGKQLMKKSGAMGPPVLMVNGAYFSGFDPVAWSNALKRNASKLKKNNFFNDVYASPHLPSENRQATSKLVKINSSLK